MMQQQAQTTNLYGQARDYPQAPPGFTAEQVAWWNIVVQLLRQQDQEIQALQAAANDSPTAPVVAPVTS